MGKRGRHKSNDNYNNRQPIREEEDSEQEFRGPQTENKINVQAKTQGQKAYIREIINNDIVLCQGPAGSGKTIVAIGMALQYVLGKNSTFKKIILMRPVKEACEESIGFLPGDIHEKMSVWAAPVADNLLEFMNKGKVDYLFKTQLIEVIPLAFCRGRSLNDAFIILDEAQNCSPKQMLMALTRIGKNSKMVVNGDITQNDSSGSGKTGLEDAIDRLSGMSGIGIVQLDESDIVRNPMIGEIIRRYQ